MIRYLNAGEKCVTVSFGNEVSLELNTKVRMLKQALTDEPIVGIEETVPTYCALSVHFDPVVIRYKELIKELEKRLANLPEGVTDEEKEYKEVPVYYGGETGPDLEYCAELEGVSVEELIRKHSQHPYYVYQLGFSPGHPYMARFEEGFFFKRRETPRVDIPGHSVVVQQNLTNITPFHQPSGWNIIGSTPINITDYKRANPFFFRAGDWVKIKPIDKAEYDRIKKENAVGAPSAHCAKSERAGENAGRKGFTVISPGALTTIQDAGRFGYQDSGVTPAGPMDEKSFRLANMIVGNEKSAAVLECTVIGPRLKFDVDTVICVTGADLSAKINGNEIPMYESVEIHAGDELSFGARRSGCRAYVAFAGGIDAPKVMGSCATDIKNELGGICGRALAAGDEVGLLGTGPNRPNWSVGDTPFCTQHFTLVQRGMSPPDTIVLRVVLGPQEDRFTAAGRRHFFNHSATVTERCDRQGIRLDCDPIEFVTDGNIISDGISFGAIQVPNDGKPIILMSDRQSVGGYAKLGNVIRVDLPKLAQAMPGDKVRFVEVSRELAEELYIKEMM